MTTYAYPISLYEYHFNELELLLNEICQEYEKQGIQIYNPDTGRPTSTLTNILEIMKEAKASAPTDTQFLAPVVTFTLTDYLFIPLESLLKDQCKKYKEETGNDPFNALTGEPQIGYATMLEAMRLAIKNMSLNSYSTFS